MAGIVEPTPALTHSHSTVSTPGADFPGAYPRGADKGAPNATADLSKSLETAKQYIPNQQTFLNAGTTAKQYIPQAITSYFPGGRQPDRLPENGRSESTFSGISTEAMAGSSVGTVTPTESLPAGGKFTNEPVIAPPGLDEPIVPIPKSKSPEVAEAPSANPDGRNYALGHEGSQWKDITEKLQIDKELPTHPDSTFNASGNVHPNPDPAVPILPETKPSNATSTMAVSGHSRPTSEVKIPSPVTSSPPTSTFTTSSNGSKFKEQPPTPTSNNSSDKSTASPSRSRFMDKVKGEVKIISGKIGKNEEKVEEGRRLMGRSS